MVVQHWARRVEVERFCSSNRFDRGATVLSTPTRPLVSSIRSTTSAMYNVVVPRYSRACWLWHTTLCRSSRLWRDRCRHSGSAKEIRRRRRTGSARNEASPKRSASGRMTRSASTKNIGSTSTKNVEYAPASPTATILSPLNHPLRWTSAHFRRCSAKPEVQTLPHLRRRSGRDRALG